jgi:hypothetical protein
MIPLLHQDATVEKRTVKLMDVMDLVPFEGATWIVLGGEERKKVFKAIRLRHARKELKHLVGGKLLVAPFVVEVSPHYVNSNDDDDGEGAVLRRLFCVLHGFIKMKPPAGSKLVHNFDLVSSNLNCWLNLFQCAF